MQRLTLQPAPRLRRFDKLQVEPAFAPAAGNRPLRMRRHVSRPRLVEAPHAKPADIKHQLYFEWKNLCRSGPLHPNTACSRASCYTRTFSSAEERRTPAGPPRWVGGEDPHTAVPVQVKFTNSRTGRQPVALPGGGNVAPAGELLTGLRLSLGHARSKEAENRGVRPAESSPLGSPPVPAGGQQR